MIYLMIDIERSIIDMVVNIKNTEYCMMIINGVKSLRYDTFRMRLIRLSIKLNLVSESSFVIFISF